MNNRRRNNYYKGAYEVTPEKREQGVKGFIHVECPKCHKTKGMFQREHLTEVLCTNCGEMIDLRESIPMHFKCECGKKLTYMTNMKSNMADVNCFDCGCPVAVTYNAKKNRYEVIR